MKISLEAYGRLAKQYKRVCRLFDICEEKIRLQADEIIRLRDEIEVLHFLLLGRYCLILPLICCLLGLNA